MIFAVRIFIFWAKIFFSFFRFVSRIFKKEIIIIKIITITRNLNHRVLQKGGEIIIFMLIGVSFHNSSSFEPFTLKV